MQGRGETGEDEDEAASCPKATELPKTDSRRLAQMKSRGPSVTSASRKRPTTPSTVARD